MTIIQNHVDLLLDKYNLKVLYKKFVYSSILNALSKDLFFWVLLYFMYIIPENMDKLKYYSIILLFILGMNIPIKRYTSNIRIKLIEEISIANTKYYIDRMIHISKTQILNLDLIRYFNSLDSLNDNIENYIMNIKVRNEIPFKLVTLIFISLTISRTKDSNSLIIIFLFIILYSIVKIYNDKKIVQDVKLHETCINYEHHLRNYVVNSKNLLINNNLNKEYLIENYISLYNNYRLIGDKNNKYNLHINSLVFIVILIIILIYIKKLNAINFISYFIILNDINFVINRVNLYYINKFKYDKIEVKINYLNNFTIESNKYNSHDIIDKIIITRLSHDKPYLTLKGSITIYKNEHILLDGLSGSGKTSLLYFLKGILKIEDCQIEPNIDIINNQTYLTLPNHKSIYSGMLYNIISNYEINPDINLIMYSLKLANIDTILNENKLIDIDKLSAGEFSRLLIARLVYIIKSHPNYTILLFDEIDENLNEELALRLCKQIKNIFNDKIILYISHNVIVKKEFTKKITVNNGIIESI